MAPHPRFLVLEGTEGAGKSSQIKALKEHYGDRIVTTREPGGSPYAEEIRELILKGKHAATASGRTMLALFWAARLDHLEHTVKPALDAGKVVVCDRFDASTYAFQICAQEQPHLKELFFLLREQFLRETLPGLYVLLDVDPVIGIGRKAKQADGGADERNHFDERKIEFHVCVRQGLKQFFGEANAPHQIIDASRSQSEVFDDLVAVIDKALAA